MRTERSEIQHRKMTENSIRSLIIYFAAPTTVSMIVTALYSLADAFFVSELGTAASAAVGVTFAIQALIQAVGYTLGMGAGSLMSRSLGAKRNKDANSYAITAFFLSILFGILIMTVGLVWGAWVIRLLGATPSVFPLALSYAKYIFLAAPFMCVSFVLSQLLRAEGKVIWSMAGLAVGSILNIVLDPFFIHTCHMGITGASFATLISQIVGVVVLFSAYLFKQTHVNLLTKCNFRQFQNAGQIFLTGLPSTFRQGLIALATILTNHAAALWSNAAVAAISVVTRLFLLAFSICLGVGQGMMPVVGYNYGFGRFDRVRQAFWFSVLLSSISMLAVSIPVLIWTEPLIRFFRNDPEVIAIGTVAMRLQCSVFLLHGLITCTIMMLQAIGKRLAAAVLACARQGLFFLPLIFWIPSAFKIQALIYVQPIADALTFLFAIPFVIHLIRFLKQKEKNAEKSCAISPQS